MTGKTYEEGLRDGKIESLEHIANTHATRLDSHSRRIGMLEKVAWIMLGIVVTIQALPTLKTVLGGG